MDIYNNELQKEIENYLNIDFNNLNIVKIKKSPKTLLDQSEQIKILCRSNNDVVDIMIVDNKFKDLILIGKIEDSYMNRIFYKDDNNMFIFFIRYSREICVIRKITNMQKEYDKPNMRIEITGEDYYYSTKTV